MSIEVYEIIFGISSIVIAISLHELMHAVTGYLLGDDTARLKGRISFNPLAHIDIFTTILLPLLLLISGAPPIGAARPVPFNPARLRYDEYGAALLAFAGPATNFLLAVVGSTMYQLAEAQDWAVASLGFQIFTLVNVGFFVFNLLPIPPLDGSRVFYAFAPQPIRNVMDDIERLGFIVLLIVLILGYPLLQPLLLWANRAVISLIV